MRDYKDYKDLQYSELDFPTVTLILKIIFSFIYFFTLLLFPLVFYVVISLSVNRMSRYRVLILIQITFSFTFSTIFFVWQPKFFFPMWLSTPSGFIDFGPSTHFIFFPCAVFCLVGALHVSALKGLKEVTEELYIEYSIRSEKSPIPETMSGDTGQCFLFWIRNQNPTQNVGILDYPT